MWSTTVPLNPKVQKLWSYFYTSCDFAHVGGGTLFWPKVNIQYLPEQVASYTSYFFPNWEPHAKFQAILMGRFWDLWKKYHFLGMGAPHYTRRQTGPSPAGNDKRFDKIRKKPWSWPPRECRGALWRYLAYVVEGHASACPRTVGVGKCVWCCLILPSNVYFNLKWYSSVWHLWTNFRSLNWTKALFNKLTLWKNKQRETRNPISTIFRFQNR